MGKLVRFLFISACVLLVNGNSIENSWFSVYGNSGYGRPVVDGQKLGTMSKFACSRLCGRDADCDAFQFELSSDNSLLGTCISFKNYIMTNEMTEIPGVVYYEKRSCNRVFPVNAATLHRDDYYSSMFSNYDVRVHKFTMSFNSITGENPVDTYPISSVYPGYTDTVDAVFEMMGINPRKTILIKGTSEKCFIQDRGSSRLAFTSCPDTRYLASFFSSSGLTEIDGVNILDDTPLQLHVFAKDRVYHLLYDSAVEQFLLKDNFDQSQVISSNPWHYTFDGITATYRLTSRVYYLFHGPKYIKYDINTGNVLKGPFLLCAD